MMVGGRQMHHFRDPGRWTSIGTWPRVPRIVLAVFLAACASLLAPAAAWALTGTTTALVSDHNPSVFGQAVTFTRHRDPIGRRHAPPGP